VTASIGITVGLAWRGIGLGRADLFRNELRLGFVSIFWARGAIIERLALAERTTRAARERADALAAAGRAAIARLGGRG
jgi:hypothetical protein